MRAIIRSMSSIVTMDLLISLEKMLETIRKKLIMVGIHESSYQKRVVTLKAHKINTSIIPTVHKIRLLN